MRSVPDRGTLWLSAFTVLAVAIAVDPPIDFLRTVASVVAGALLGLIISRYYSKRASEELTHEAGRLKHLTNMILRAMQEAGLASFNWNEETGEAEGLKINLNGIVVARSDASATATVTRKEDPDESP